MQFVVIGQDGTDAEAPTRRAAARAAHLERTAAFKGAGNCKYAVALTNDDGQMIGSIMVMEFPDRSGLDAWLEEEPYVTGSVWQQIQVTPATVAPLFQ